MHFWSANRNWPLILDLQWASSSLSCLRVQFAPLLRCPWKTAHHMRCALAAFCEWLVLMSRDCMTRFQTFRKRSCGRLMDLLPVAYLATQDSFWVPVILHSETETDTMFCALSDTAIDITLWDCAILHIDFIFINVIRNYTVPTSPCPSTLLCTDWKARHN